MDDLVICLITLVTVVKAQFINADDNESVVKILYEENIGFGVEVLVVNFVNSILGPSGNY